MWRQEEQDKDEEGIQKKGEGSAQVGRPAL